VPMLQFQSPIFPSGLTAINEDFSFQQVDATVVYFHGLLPVFQHDQKYLKSFRMWNPPNNRLAAGRGDDWPRCNGRRTPTRDRRNGVWATPWRKAHNGDRTGSDDLPGSLRSVCAIRQIRARVELWPMPVELTSTIRLPSRMKKTRRP
jgi:hypothetical protein